MNQNKIEAIFWSAIKDIESENGKLTKINVCKNTAKYNNGKSISRPTLDNYDSISQYISEAKKKDTLSFVKEENKLLIEKIDLLENEILNLKSKNLKLINSNKNSDISRFQF